MSYEDVAGPDDLLLIQQIVESGAKEVSDEQAEKLARLGYVQEGKLTARGRALYDDMMEKRECVLDALRSGRTLNAADLRDYTKGGTGTTSLVRFEDDVDGEEAFPRAIADWMRLRDELRLDHENRRYVLTVDEPED